MAEKFQNKYRIPSARLQYWDYGWNAAYFITICTKDRACVFGEIKNGSMNLSGIGIIADVLWYEIKNHAKDIELGEFIVMPNHIHGIIILNGNDATNISAGVNDPNDRNRSDIVSNRDGFNDYGHSNGLHDSHRFDGSNDLDGRNDLDGFNDLDHSNNLGNLDNLDASNDSNRSRDLGHSNDSNRSQDLDDLDNRYNRDNRDNRNNHHNCNNPNNRRNCNHHPQPNPKKQSDNNDFKTRAKTLCHQQLEDTNPRSPIMPTV